MDDFISPMLISAHKLAWLIGEKQVFFFVDMADGPGDSEQEDHPNAQSLNIKAVK